MVQHLDAILDRLSVAKREAGAAANGEDGMGGRNAARLYVQCITVYCQPCSC